MNSFISFVPTAYSDNKKKERIEKDTFKSKYFLRYQRTVVSYETRPNGKKFKSKLIVK